MGIRPLMTPHTAALPGLRECLRACAALAGKPLPPDPAAATPTASGLSADGTLGGALAGGMPTPQYVPILPKPPTSILVSGAGGLEMASPSPAAGVPGGGAYMVTPSGTPTLISPSVVS